MWQAVVLLPFIDEGRLLTHVKPLEDELVGEERFRNEHGPTYIFVHRSHPAADLILAAPTVAPGPPSYGDEPKGPEAPDLKRMNELGAAVLKAELSGDEDAEAKLKAELEEFRQKAAEYLVAVQMKSAAGLPLDPVTHQMNGTVALPENAPKPGDVIKALPFAGNRAAHK